VLDHLDQRDQLRTEKFGAAAIMGERHQRVAGVEIALYGAEVGFHRPEGGDDAGGNAVILLGLGEDVGILLHLLAANVEARLADGALREFEEGLLEDALCAVAAQNLGVDLGACKRLIGSLGGGTGGDRIGFDTCQELREIAVAGNSRRLRRGGSCRGRGCRLLRKYRGC
jgi:hypothetical protein